MHKLAYKNNHNSQTYIESFHLSIQHKFVKYIQFNCIKDVYNYYISYLYFYNNLRPHGTLNYRTSNFVFEHFNLHNCVTFQTNNVVLKN
ncbi:MAG: transposase [Thermosipho sp. (in: Bacteria)]|nr:transposase [Thermosipho sp. (in: thermotogales)]